MELGIHISSHVVMPIFIGISPFVVNILTAVWTFRRLISGKIKRRFSSHNVPSLLFIAYHYVFHRGVKQPEREVDHSSPSSSEVENEWSYAYTPLYISSKHRQGQFFLPNIINLTHSLP